MLCKCGLYLLSFAVLSTSLSVFFSGVSSAASDYDEVYKETDTLNLSYAGQCNTDVNITNDWYTRILATPESQWSGGSSGYKGSLQNAINNGGRWGASQVYTYNSGNVIQKSVYIYWTEDTSLNLSWQTSQVTAKGNNRKSIEIINAKPVGYPSCDDFYIQRAGGSYAVVSKPSDGNQEIKANFVNVDENSLNLPVGYDGIIPRKSTVDDREVIKPDFKYSVQDKSISTTDYNQKLPDFVPDEGYTFSGYKVEWSLFRCDIDESHPSTCSNPDLVNHQILPQSTSYTYSVDQYYWYQIEAQYLVEQCYRYPSYPSTPDYCFYVDLNTEFDDYRFLPTSVNLNVDGRTIIGDTKLNDCDESGFCEPKKQKELYDYFADREDFGLTAVLISPLLFYQQLPSMAQTCNPITFPLFGQTISLECLKPRYQAWSPLVLGIWTAVINAVVLYAVALGLFRTINQVNDPQDDRIEVQKL